MKQVEALETKTVVYHSIAHLESEVEKMEKLWAVRTIVHLDFNTFAVVYERNL